MTDLAYERRKQRLVAELSTATGATLALAKSSSNLFRERERAPRKRLDVRDFHHVLGVDPGEGWVDAEGMTTYETLVAATLEHGVMPAVVPQLKSITIGGAVAGVGIEASSFRYGLVHETMQELEVLLADGSVIRCTPDNEHRDLYYGFPNSYGTLGYALRLRTTTAPVKPYVVLEHRRHRDAARFFADLEAACDGDADFVDGVVFCHDELYLTLGRFRDAAPYVSDYTFEHIYYQSIRRRTEDYLSVHDYLWRWNTDWFWCSKQLGAHRPFVRRLLGRERLNSIFYTKIMRWNARVGLTRLLDRARGLHRESVIQDVDIPIERAAEFLDFFLREVGVLPVWICPTRTHRASASFTLFPTKSGVLYVNFGFWDVVRTARPRPPGHFNRMIEAKVEALGGIKSLYSDAYFSPEEFWRIYGGDTYHSLKRRYDPHGRLPDLYQKCVLRH